MRSISRVSLAVAASAVLVGSMALPASADVINSTVSGSALTATTSGATLAGVTLNGTGTQTATGTASSAWSVTDARGTGAAWTLSASATAPTSAAGTVETVARNLPVGNLKINPGTVTAEDGADAATNITGPQLSLTGSAQALVSASGTSKGKYTLTPTYSLDVPANAYRSNYSAAVNDSALNPYTSTITYTIA